MSITKEEQLKELEALQDCLKDMSLEHQLIQKAGKEQLPALSINLPQGDSGRNYSLVCCFLPLEDSQSEFVKYLQMYVELEAPLPDEQMPVTLLLLMNQINQILVVGQCFWRMGNESEGLPNAIGIRYTLPTSRDQPIDEGCFGESLILMTDALYFLDYILEATKNPEKAQELLQQLDDLIQDSH